MWNIESLNQKKRHQNNTKLTQNQTRRDNETTISPKPLLSTPNKAIVLQSPSGFPFDFTFFFSNLSSEQKAQNLHEATAHKLYSNIIYKSDSPDEQIAEYSVSNQSDAFKTFVSNSKLPYANPHSNNIASKKNLFAIFENAKNDSNSLKKETSSYDKDFLSSPPRTKNSLKMKNKKLFECSGSTAFCTTHKKKRRFRKNKEQVNQLLLHYKKSNNWSKEHIKEISDIIGLNENKVYKWLWDQNNKEIKKAKFRIKKD